MSMLKEWNERRKTERAELEAARRLPPRSCPMCGGDLEPGCLFSRRNGLFWHSALPPTPRWLKAAPIEIDAQGLPLDRFKNAWFCQGCQQMIFIMPEPGKAGAEGPA